MAMRWSLQVIGLLVLAVALAGGLVACDQGNRPVEPTITTEHAEDSPQATAACLPCRGHKIAVTAETPRANHEGTTYYFCSEGCKEIFVENPAKYLPKTPSTLPSTAMLPALPAAQ